MSRSPAVAQLPTSASVGAQRCSVLGTLRLVGDFWTLGIIRSAVYGMRRFSEFEEELGVASNILTDRLKRLVEAGVFDRVPYQDRPVRYEYVLTAAGNELSTVVLALKLWGDRHVQDDGAWTAVCHDVCETPLHVVALCPDCGEPTSLADTRIVRLRD